MGLVKRWWPTSVLPVHLVLKTMHLNLHSVPTPPVPLVPSVHFEAVPVVLPVPIMPCVPPGRTKRRPPLSPRILSVPIAALVNSKTSTVKLPVKIATLVNTKAVPVVLPVPFLLRVPPGRTKRRPPLPPRIVSVPLVSPGFSKAVPMALHVPIMPPRVPPGRTKRWPPLPPRIVSVSLVPPVHSKAVVCSAVPIAALVHSKTSTVKLPVKIAKLVNTKTSSVKLPVPIAALINTKTKSVKLPVWDIKCVPPGHHKRRPPLPPRILSVPIAALINTKTKSIKLPVWDIKCVPPGHHK